MNTFKFLCTASLLFTLTCSHAQSAVSAKKSALQNNNQNPSAFFNGAWRNAENKMFSVMHDGYFNTVAQDSSGKWNAVHAGTYTVNNDNTITLKVLYSSFPDHIGAANTAEYTISGETVKMRYFKKLINASGKDITEQMPKDARETIIRVR